MFYKYLFFFFVLCFASTVFAQESDISGKYEGTADAKPFGKLKISAEIRDKNGVLSGVLHTPLGDAEIIEGRFALEKFSIKVDAGGDDLFLNGRRERDGKLNGTVTSETANGTFELSRVGDLEAEKDYSIILRQSKEKWREDLRFLSEELSKRHKNAFNRITRPQFEKMVADLDAKIPSLSDDEIVWEMIRIVSKIGDGHTGLSVGNSYPRIPMWLYWFGKELRVARVSKDFPRLSGARLVKINGVAVEKIYEQTREYIPQGETEQFTLSASPYLMTYPVFLKISGVGKDAEKAVYEFVDTNGKRFKQELKGVAQNGENAKIDWISPYKTAPLYLQNEDKPLSFHYFKDAQTVYVNFRWYPRRQEFAEFSGELFDFIDKNPVEKLVIDMRHNGGGDFTRGRDFLVKQIKERKKFLERGRLFVITGRVTYSAGMANTADFKNDLNAVLVGEPTGARPNGYQEGRGLGLPNSHLWLNYSVEFYKFSETDTPGILPEKRIEPDWKSFQSGRDAALEWILNFKGKI
jgi:hypothetical protein